MKKKQIPPKKWVKTEVVRIKLNPEQAVLSCCDSQDKRNTLGGTQCSTGNCGTGGSLSASS
ncbi:MAG: hypothetical protein PHP69_07450 [Candidatus Omnitrophica bacterium]|nr:hypothetical protein [Candidatus Omnitrophota bacterium]MDD5081341.1 hypothetical protein [Candidatus Omnitrophota bacterium]